MFETIDVNCVTERVPVCGATDPEKNRKRRKILYFDLFNWFEYVMFSKSNRFKVCRIYLSIFNGKKPNFRAFWKLCSHFFPFQWTFMYIFGGGGHLGAKRGRGYLGARMLFELNLLFNMTFTRRSSLVNNKHHNITFSIDLTDDVDIVDCNRQLLLKKELILFSWNTREADINRPDGVVFWRMKFSLKCLP